MRGGWDFRAQYIDFRKGIRVGHLEPQQRITQIFKALLRSRHETDFVIDRWGRGIYWQWICFVPREIRGAKPLSGRGNFCSSKLFLMVDREEELFKAGLQIERGFLRAPAPFAEAQLAPDWDWHHLLAALREDPVLARSLRRLVRKEGFRVMVGNWEERHLFDRHNLPPEPRLASLLEEGPPEQWWVFQLYYAMTPGEVRSCSGAELVEAVSAVFQEVVPVMNRCMDVPLRRSS